MKKIWLMVMCLALVLAVVGLVGCSSGGATLSGEGINLKSILGNQQEGIWISGTGKVSAVPDIAVLSLGVEAQDTSVASAQSQANEAMGRVMTALTGSGVAETDIQTRYFSIQRVTRWDNDKQQEIVIGYRVSNTVSAKIRSLDKTGSIIDTVVTAGGDLIRFDGIGFSVEDPSVYYEDARVKAMADATAKAEQLASLAGVTLGKPTYISESSYVPIPVSQRVTYAEDIAAETPISPGEMEITLTVQVTYDIMD